MRKKLNGSEHKNTGLTARVTASDAENFRQACYKIGAMPASILRMFIEKCGKDGEIPIDYLPANMIAKMEQAVKSADKYREILKKVKGDL